MEVSETNKRGKEGGKEERKKRPGRTSKDFLESLMKPFLKSSYMKFLYGPFFLEKQR